MQDRSRSLWPLVAAAAILAIAGVAVAIIVRGNPSTSGPHSTIAVAAQTESTSATATTVPTPKVVHRTKTVIQPTKTVTQTAGSAPTVPPSAAAPPSATPPGLVACDQNISVNASTSCPFADNVFNQYAIDVQHGGSGSYQVYAYSPATGDTYTDNCQLNSATQFIDCSHGGDLVQFPEWAAAVYVTH